MTRCDFIGSKKTQMNVNSQPKFYSVRPRGKIEAVMGRIAETRPNQKKLIGRGRKGMFRIMEKIPTRDSGSRICEKIGSMCKDFNLKIRSRNFARIFASINQLIDSWTDRHHR